MELERTGLFGDMVATAYNLVRRSRLIAAREAEVPVSVGVPLLTCACQTLGRGAEGGDVDMDRPKPPQSHALCGCRTLYAALRAVLPQPAREPHTPRFRTRYPVRR